MEKRENYRKYLLSADWKMKRDWKMTQAGPDPRCSICGDRWRLEVHHVVYRDLYMIGPEDLRILCKRCHLLIHKLHSRGMFVLTGDDPAERFAIVRKILRAHLGVL